MSKIVLESYLSALIKTVVMENLKFILFLSYLNKVETTNLFRESHKSDILKFIQNFSFTHYVLEM